MGSRQSCCLISPMSPALAAKKRRTQGPPAQPEAEAVAVQEEPLGLLDALPDTLVVYNVLAYLDPSALCSLAAASRRHRQMQAASDTHLWGQVVSSRWAGSHVQEACALAGSFKAFALQKASSSQVAEGGWKGPCEFELQVALQRLTAHLGAATSGHIIFLLDGSGSVGDEEFAASTSFIARAANSLKGQAEHGCKVSVLQFSNDVRVEWEDAAEAPPAPAAPGFEATIKSMVRINGGTNISAALAHAGRMLKKAASPDAAKAIVLITDGRVDGYQAKEARQVAAALADEQPNTSLFAFGVGRGIDREELLSIIQAAPPSRPEYREASARYLDLFYRDEAYW